jgi:hypothetical protein
MNDQYEGEGGSYMIDGVTGARVLVSRTEEAPPPDPDPPVLTEIVVPAEPANAGFFTPVAVDAPAESTTTTE